MLSNIKYCSANTLGKSGVRDNGLAGGVLVTPHLAHGGRGQVELFDIVVSVVAGGEASALDIGRGVAGQFQVVPSGLVVSGGQ